MSQNPIKNIVNGFLWLYWVAREMKMFETTCFEIWSEITHLDKTENTYLFGNMSHYICIKVC